MYLCASFGRRRTRTAANVVQSKRAHAGVKLEEQRKGLANATGGTENSDLGVLRQVN